MALKALEWFVQGAPRTAVVKTVRYIESWGFAEVAMQIGNQAPDAVLLLLLLRLSCFSFTTNGWKMWGSRWDGIGSIKFG